MGMRLPLKEQSFTDFEWLDHHNHIRTKVREDRQYYSNETTFEIKTINLVLDRLSIENINTIFHSFCDVIWITLIQHIFF